MQVLADLGMIPIEDKMAKVKPTAYNVLVDGKVVGFLSRSEAPAIVEKLRILKIKKDDQRSGQFLFLLLGCINMLTSGAL